MKYLARTQEKKVPSLSCGALRLLRLFALNFALFRLGLSQFDPSRREESCCLLGGALLVPRARLIKFKNPAHDEVDHALGAKTNGLVLNGCFEVLANCTLPRLR